MKPFMICLFTTLGEPTQRLLPARVESLGSKKGSMKITLLLPELTKIQLINSST